MFQHVTGAYGRLVNAASSLQSVFLLLVRLYWGWQFFETGWGKLQHLPKVAQFFASLGLPAPAFTAAMVGTTELVGGALLFVGLASRLSGLALFCSMSVAYLPAERSALLSILSDPGKFYGSDAYTFWFAALLIVLFGPGSYSLDALLLKWRSHERTGVAESPLDSAESRKAKAQI